MKCFGLCTTSMIKQIKSGFKYVSVRVQNIFLSPQAGGIHPSPDYCPFVHNSTVFSEFFVVKYKVEKSGQISRKWAIKMSNVREGGGGQLFRKNEISFIPSPCVINERSFKTPRKCTGRGYPRLFSYFFLFSFLFLLPYPHAHK